MNAFAREHTLAQIRHRRALGLAKPRRRIPRQLRPVGIQLGYFQALRPMLAAMRGEVERLIVPRLAEWVENGKRLRGDAGQARPDPVLVVGHAAGAVHGTFGDELQHRIGALQQGVGDGEFFGQVLGAAHAPILALVFDDATCVRTGEWSARGDRFEEVVVDAVAARLAVVVEPARGPVHLESLLLARAGGEQRRDGAAGIAGDDDAGGVTRFGAGGDDHGPSLSRRLDSAISAKDAIDKAVEAFNQRQESHGAVLSQIADRTARRTSDFQAVQLQRQVRAALGVELPPQDVGLQQRIQEFTVVNVALIKSIPATYFGQVEAVVLHGVSSGRRHEDIASDLVARFGVAEDRAALIARDQVGKLYGRLNEARQAAIGVTSFVWRTVHDARVRDEHAGYDGNTFEWANPPEDGIPGEAVNCRCSGEPVFDGVLAMLNGE